MTAGQPAGQPVWTPPVEEPSPFRAHLLAIAVGGIVLLVAVVALGVWASRAEPVEYIAPVPVVDSSPAAGLATVEDQQFIGLLDRLGVPIADAPVLARSGRDFCAHLDRGAKAPAEATAIADAFSFTPEQGTEVVRTAVVAYCPKYRAPMGLPS